MTHYAYLIKCIEAAQRMRKAAAQGRCARPLRKDASHDPQTERLEQARRETADGGGVGDKVEMAK